MSTDSIEPFLDYFERVRERTRRVVLCVPPEQLEWTHKAGAFTFGDLIRHLGAIERWMFAENAQGRPSRYPGHGPELAAGHAAVLEYFDAMHRESVEIFRRLTPEDLARRCETPGGAAIAVWKWLRSMVEHEIHHRGQIYLMLGILGIPTPPLYGLTSEEVRERSRPGPAIRPATASDAPELTVIARAAKRHWGYPEAWLAAWEPVLTITPEYVGRNTVLVAERAAMDGGVVAFVGLVDAGTHWELDHLWVLPEHQGHGLGSRLFAAALEEVRSRRPGVLRIEAEPYALGFYERCGARQVGTVAAPVLGTPRDLPLLELTV